MALNKTLLAAALAVAALSGCKKEAAPAAEAPAGDAVPATAEPAVAADAPPAAPDAAAAPAAPPATPFDITTVPVSDKPAGDWPYVPAPAGYAYPEARTLDLSRVPFWNGQSLQFVEGKVYETRIRAEDGKEYSRFEVLKRIDEALTALGAVKIVTAKIPDQVLEDELPEDFGVEFNAGAGGYYRGQELSTYVLRQADRVVWFKVYSGTKDGSLLIAETDAAATP